MNLIQQFPDISEKMRCKNRRMGQRIYRTANAVQSVTYSEDRGSRPNHYDGEFRRRHFKLFFIVAASLGTIYFALLKSSLDFNLVHR
jgi:hypothetical protein